MCVCVCVGVCVCGQMEDAEVLALYVFKEYLALVRRLQLTYKLEPAGSHGCWSLDDYQFLPFMWCVCDRVCLFVCLCVFVFGSVCVVAGACTTSSSRLFCGVCEIKACYVACVR